MTSSQVYVAGIGVTQVNAAISNAVTHELAISAGTKAMLDAGVTYDDVDHSIACFLDNELRFSKASFDTFGKTGASASEVDCASGLLAAIQSVKSGYANCALVIGFDKGTSQEGSDQLLAVGVVLVSHLFLSSHAYLKDSAALICGSAAVSPVYSRTSQGNTRSLAAKAAIRAALQNASLTPEDIDIVNSHASSPGLNESYGDSKESKGAKDNSERLALAGSTGLSGLSELVWQLRGWANDRAKPGIKHTLQCTVGPDGTAYVTILSRVNGSAAPKWEEVKHLRDGRERVGHNPAIESKRISLEDWQAVKSRDEYVPESTSKRLTLPVKGGDRAALARL